MMMMNRVCIMPPHAADPKTKCVISKLSRLVIFIFLQTTHTFSTVYITKYIFISSFTVTLFIVNVLFRCLHKSVCPAMSSDA